MTTLYCAICDRRFEPDVDHVWIEAEKKQIDDRNSVDDFALHPECWRSISGGWSDPV